MKKRILSIITALSIAAAPIYGFAVNAGAAGADGNSESSGVFHLLDEADPSASPSATAEPSASPSATATPDPSVNWADVTLPDVQLSNGTAVTDAKVTALLVSGTPDADWNNGESVIDCAAGGSQKFPPGEYKITNTTNGYTQDEVLYLVVGTDKSVTYYDSTKTTTVTNPVIKVQAVGDPTYRVQITDNKDDTYTAYITLENIAATYGTFGLKYDTKVLSFDPTDSAKFSLNSALEIKMTPEKAYGNNWNDEDGYYEFIWQAGTYGNTATNDDVFDTTLGAQWVATMKFTLEPGKTASDITLGTFTVMPWHRTKGAVADAANLPAGDPDFLPINYYSPQWRYCDSENTGTLGIGRLDKSKAVIHGVDTKGFYQGWVSGSLADSTSSYSYDIKTEIDYTFINDIEKSLLIFHVVDDETGADLDNATVRLYDSTGTAMEGIDITDWMGETSFPTDKTTATTYKYAVTRNGYRPIPKTLYPSDMLSVTTQIGANTLVEVRMQKVIYHVPVSENLSDYIVTGDPYGYNGEDFYFRMRPAAGKTITTYPTKARVTIYTDVTLSTWDITDLDVDPTTQLFKLPADKLYQSALTSAELATIGYSPQTTPDSNGFRSYNIHIEFLDYAVASTTYEVSGYAGANGVVSYTYNTGELPSTTVVTDKEEVVTTTASNLKTGTFTFTADAGYMVDRVYINGLLVHTYDDLPYFTYTFGEVDMDNNITVIFYDGTTHSNETVMTLVVGEWGKADMTSPESKTVTNTRKIYLNPTANLTFTAQATMNGYVLANIAEEIDGVRNNASINPNNTSYVYTFAPPTVGSQKDKTVYVSFKKQGETDSPTIYVKAYVKEGMGTIHHAGIQIHSIGECPKFDLDTTDADYLAWGVHLEEFDRQTVNEKIQFDPPHQTSGSYTMQPLKADIAIGGIFELKTYSVTGIVDLGQQSNLSLLTPQTGASVTFTRTDASGNPIAGKPQFTFTTTNDRHNAVFNAAVPAGWWTVTVTKQGYMKVEITKFELKEPANDTDVTEFGLDETDPDNPVTRKITPLIGSTRSQTSITLYDTSAVISGMRTNAVNASRGDVDDSGGTPNAADMAYVLYNYGKRFKSIEYSTFITTAFNDIP